MNELINSVVQQLGVNQDQAKGGMGLLLKLAGKHLSGDDFGKIKGLLDQADDLIAAAPESGGGAAGLLGRLASAVGAGKMGNLASLASGFKKLDLDTGMIGKFGSMLVSFVKSKGGEGIAGILESVLR